VLPQQTKITHLRAQVESTATCIRTLRSGDSADLFVMGNVEIVANARAARGCTSASAYKFEVLLSWDIEAPPPSSSSKVSSVIGAEQQTSLDNLNLEVREKQIEISNGLVLHEVALVPCAAISSIITLAFFMSNWEMP
jgi:hypothetical protein